MLSTTRTRALRQVSRAVQLSARRTYAFSANDNQEVNTGSAADKVPNVSKTNELPLETPGQDASLQESAVLAEERRVTQAPNRAAVWSRSQNPRAKAMSGPRFEQTIMELQVWCIQGSSCCTYGVQFGQSDRDKADRLSSQHLKQPSP